MTDMTVLLDSQRMLILITHCFTMFDLSPVNDAVLKELIDVLKRYNAMLRKLEMRLESGQSGA